MPRAANVSTAEHADNLYLGRLRENIAIAVICVSLIVFGFFAGCTISWWLRALLQ